jgi:hypothetical protein
MMLSRLAMEMQLHSGKEKFGSFCIYLSGSGKRGLPLEQDSNLQLAVKVWSNSPRILKYTRD